VNATIQPEHVRQPFSYASHRDIAVERAKNAARIVQLPNDISIKNPQPENYCAAC
jgi:non-canonical (house-cleaning) NTP pyrophosphatase